MKGDSLLAVNSISMLRHILGVERFGRRTAFRNCKGKISLRAIITPEKDWLIQFEKTYKHNEHLIHTVYLMYIFTHMQTTPGSSNCRLKPTADKRGNINPPRDLHDYCLHFNHSGVYRFYTYKCMNARLRGLAVPGNVPWLVSRSRVLHTCQVLQRKWFVVWHILFMER